MRHYGLPTRLLDWTESVLTAAFFAVEKPSENMSEEDGFIWVLVPTKLNHRICGEPRVLTATNEKVRELAAKAFVKPEKVEESKPTALAFAAEEVDLRIFAQQSMFTIHSANMCLSKLENFANAAPAETLQRLKIPVDKKEGFRDELRAFGVREAALFPDLEHLAKEISDRQLLNERLGELGYLD